MGDFVQCLYVSYHLYKRDGTKSNVILSNIGDVFENGLANTFNEFKQIVEQQEFCNSFELHNIDQKIDISVAEFRSSPYLFKANWRELLCKTYLDSEKPFPGGWLKFPTNESWPDTIVINRKPKTPFLPNLIKPYVSEIKKYKHAIYIGHKAHYDEFPLNNLCSFYEPKDMGDWFSVISKAGKVIACQSGPLHVALSLDKPTLAELLPRTSHTDWVHLLDEAQYHSDLKFTPF